MIVTGVIYDYGEQYFCPHYPQNEITIAILPLQSSLFRKRYVISLFTCLFVD
jgi:hypothetical protein